MTISGILIELDCLNNMAKSESIVDFDILPAQ